MTAKSASFRGSSCRRTRMAVLSGRGAAVALSLSSSYWMFLSPRSQLLGHFPYRAAPLPPAAASAPTERVIALTFDDGPNEPYTSQIADFLAEEAIAATFFQVGKCVERFPDTTALVVSLGHVVGNHSYSHNVFRCITPAIQKWETRRTQDLLTDKIGRPPALYRPPWLLRTPRLLRTLRKSGLHPISGVFCHPFEVFQPDARRIARHALARARPGTILIFHDGFDSRVADRTQTVGAVRMVVATLKIRGYRFVTVDELLNLPAYQ